MSAWRAVFLVRPKRPAESYAPDESHAIAQLAHDTGVALDMLYRGAPESARADIQAIYRAIQTLPAAISERIEEASRHLVADVAAGADRV